MAGLGKQVRLNRILAHQSGRLFSIALDHFVGYQRTLQDGLTDLRSTIATVIPARPDAITMFGGSARTCWGPYAGRVPLIVQTGCFTPDDRVSELLATPEEALRLGADAIAVAIGVRGPSEGHYLRMLSDIVRSSEILELPVFAHIYPRDFSAEPRVVNDPENIAWAARCGTECGADVVKIAYSGDKASFSEIVSHSPVPIVAAGGERTPKLLDALRTAHSAVAAGAIGVVVGRNVWADEHPLDAALAFAAVVHEDKMPEDVVDG